ncbi:speckle-type POZ protein-like B [Trichonephila clavata]|uniref:Speckle-type POZ protein-like B n=1 Tax=Trichonephila clavata TaxID=2740835 RepID=A0A8X6HXM0_TRICU|nr:speckle-type POZ protein-like B [Trichonephila clavata]
MAHKDADSESWTTFFWNIENYSYFWDKYAGIINSPTFQVNSLKKFSWNIVLYPRKYRGIRFFFYELNGVPVGESLGFLVKYEFATLAEDGSVLKTQKNTMYVNNKGDTMGGSSREHMTIIETETAVSQDTLRLCCRVKRMDGENVKPVTYFARTVLDVKKRNVLWDIKRFSSLGPGQKVIYAIRPNVGENAMTLSMQVNTDGEIMVFINTYDTKMKCLKFQLFLTDTNGSKVDCGKYTKWPSDFKISAICKLPYIKKYLIQNQHYYLKNDVLSLHYKCSWLNEPSLTETIERIDFGISSAFIGDEVSAKSYSPPSEVRRSDKMLDLQEDLKCLYDEGIFSDLKLSTSSQIFNVHKNILYARSPVFRAMLTTDMKEKIQECVDVSDLEDETVRRMLLYLYTNALEDLEWESALKLYAAADKYRIVSLKNKCASFLKCNLCPNNLCEGLVLADMHGDADLKEAAQNYILRHEQDIFRSEIR